MDRGDWILWCSGWGGFGGLVAWMEYGAMGRGDDDAIDRGCGAGGVMGVAVIDGGAGWMAGADDWIGVAG